MSISERNFPSSIELGETLTAIYLIPSIEGYTTGIVNPGDDADAYQVSFSNSGNSNPEVEFPAVLSADSFRFDIAAKDADPATPFWEAGSFTYRIVGTWTRDGVERTLSFARGIVDVIQTGVQRSDSLSHARGMIVLLRGILQDKACGSSDVIDYSIGGRTISLISYDSLHRQLTRYENDVIRLAGGYPHFDSGTEVV